MEQRNIRLEGADGRPFLMDVFSPEGEHPRGAPEEGHHGLVVFCHGFKGFKDWGCWDLLARAFVEEGYAFAKLNWSHNGTTVDDPLNFADLEAFGHNNFSKELEDLERALDWILAGDQLEAHHIDPDNVTLIGHSRGGATVLFKAVEDERVTRVVTWAGVGSLKSYFRAEEVDEWRAAGVHYIDNARTGQRMPLYFQLHEDIANNPERLDLERTLRRLTQPYLVVHGSLDQTVDYAAALHLYENTQNSQLETVMGGDHAFGGKHPWESDELPIDMEVAFKRTVAFIESPV